MLSEELMFRRRALMAQKAQPDALYEAYNLSFNGVDDYIDTGVYLFTQENINRDFEFIAEGVYGNYHFSDDTIICERYNGTQSGFLVRASGSTTRTYNGSVAIKRNTISNIIIRRTNGVLSLSGYNITNPTVNFTNAVFNWSLHLGCAIDDNGNRYRYAEGTIDHVVVRWL